ncbi:MAG TPA: hypothetical protein VIO64_18255 [Pseudobacteroides sp.]|uniref:hypothetical protein n=1 Tax=Pseudobacteroides sp. TaxID=1968840 RepID=UPI002F91D984
MDIQTTNKPGKSIIDSIFISVLFLLTCLILYVPAMQNDTYWLINTGKYIINAGFPITETFTIHEGLVFNAQQWLTQVIFYWVFNLFGDFGIHVLCISIYILISMFIYKLTLLLSDNNKFISLGVSLYSIIFLSFYMVPRPQIFSILIFVLAIYCLEVYLKNKKLYALFLIPLLSVILVNVHSAMWVFLFLLMVPYIIDGFRFKILIIGGQGYSIATLAAMFLSSIAAGFINPYGLRNMIYVVYSYGNKMVGASISEMQSPDFKGVLGIIIFLVLLVFVLVHIMVKGKTRLRYVLITIGTVYMGLSSVRSFALFLVCGLPFLAYFLKGISFPTSISVSSRIRHVLVAVIIGILIIAGVFKKYDYTDKMNEFRPIGAVEYIKKNVRTDDIRLYNDFNTGGYIEFAGLKTFIDSRAEIFLKSLNKKEDIIIDFFNMRKGSMHYKKFIGKYKFTHYLMSKKDPLYVLLSEDADYMKAYEDDKFVVYVNAD